MSEMCVRVLDLCICQIALRHIMCVWLFWCVSCLDFSFRFWLAVLSLTGAALWLTAYLTPLAHNTLYISQGGFCLCQCVSQPLISHHSCSARLATWEEEGCNYVKRLNTALSPMVKRTHWLPSCSETWIFDFRMLNQSANSFSPPETVPVTTFVSILCSLKTTSLYNIK